MMLASLAEREQNRDLFTGRKGTKNPRNYFDNNYGDSFTFYRNVSFRAFFMSGNYSSVYGTS